MATMPTGTIGDLELSRMLLGGNMLSHYNHCRDQNYVFRLLEHYNTPEKLLETFAIAEENGITGMNVHQVDWVHQLLKQHRDRGGKMKWIWCPCEDYNDLDAYRTEVMHEAELGCDAFYIWGVHGDPLTEAERFDTMGKMLDIFRETGRPAGVGCHSLDVVKASEANGLDPDFYVKTFHHHDYPSGPKVPASELEYATDEIVGYWDRDPAETRAFMQTVEKPWIAFKTMAAGTIDPESAFTHALEGGADFVFTGMFDYEIAGDADIFLKVLSAVQAAGRARPWRA